MPAAALRRILMTTPCDKLTDVFMDTAAHDRAVVDGPQNPSPPQGAAVYEPAAQPCPPLKPIHDKASLLELVQLQRLVHLVQLQQLVPKVQLVQLLQLVQMQQPAQTVQIRQIVHLVQPQQLARLVQLQQRVPLVQLQGVFETFELFSDRELHHVPLTLPW
jgi:hypothetical protein